jgi:hypothetical protein
MDTDHVSSNVEDDASRTMEPRTGNTPNSKRIVTNIAHKAPLQCTAISRHGKIVKKLLDPAG